MQRLNPAERLTFVHVLLGLGLALSLYLGAAWLMSGEMERQTQQRVQRRAEVLADRLQSQLNLARILMQQMARTTAAMGTSDALALRRELSALQAQAPLFAWVGVVQPDGVVLAGSRGWLEGDSIARRPVFQEGSKGLFFGDFHPAVVLKPLMQAEDPQGVQVADLSLPVQAYDGRVLGVLAAHLDARWFVGLGEKSITPEDRQRLGLQWHLYVSNGQALNDNTALPAMSEAERNSDQEVSLPSPPGQDLVAVSKGFALPGSDPRARWHVVVSQDLQQVAEPVRRPYRNLALMAAALVLAFGVVAYVSIRRATRPFAHLFEAANQRFQAAGGEAAMPYGSYLDGLGDELIADGAATQDPDHALLRRIATDAQQLKRVIDALPMAVAIHGPDRRPLYVNATYTELLGWRLDDLVGPSTLEFLVPPQEREAYGQMLRELGDPPREVGARFSAACKDGHRIDVQWQFVPLFDRQQRFDGGLTLIHDISKEVAARRRVQALNLRLSVVADAAVNYALIMTDERGRITAWSRGAQALFGGSAAQMRGRGLEQLFDEAQFSARLRLQELIQQALGSDRVDVERRFRRGDGGSFIGRASFYSVGVLGQEGYALIIADVTQEREAALRLAQNESRMAGIIASASDAIISVDVEGRIELFNPAAERIFQIPAAEMLGQPLDRLLPPMARHLHQGHLASFAASKVSRRSMGAGRVEGVRADGQILILEASISQTMAGERSVLTAILRDVTDDRLSADRDRPAS